MVMNLLHDMYLGLSSSLPDIHHHYCLPQAASSSMWTEAKSEWLLWKPWCKLKELVIRGKHDSLVVNTFVVPDAALSEPKHRLSFDDFEELNVWRSY